MKRTKLTQQIRSGKPMKRNMEWNKWSDLIRKPLKALRIFSENCAISSQFSPCDCLGEKNVNSRELFERSTKKKRIKMNWERFSRMLTNNYFFFTEKIKCVESFTYKNFFLESNIFLVWTDAGILHFQVLRQNRNANMRDREYVNGYRVKF